MINALLAYALLHMCYCHWERYMMSVPDTEVQLGLKHVVVIYLVGLGVAECGEWQLALAVGVSDCVGGCCYGGVL